MSRLVKRFGKLVDQGDICLFQRRSLGLNIANTCISHFYCIRASIRVFKDEPKSINTYDKNLYKIMGKGMRRGPSRPCYSSSIIRWLQHHPLTFIDAFLLEDRHGRLGDLGEVLCRQRQDRGSRAAEADPQQPRLGGGGDGFEDGGQAGDQVGAVGLVDLVAHCGGDQGRGWWGVAEGGDQE